MNDQRPRPYQSSLIILTDSLENILTSIKDCATRLTDHQKAGDALIAAAAEQKAKTLTSDNVSDLESIAEDSDSDSKSGSSEERRLPKTPVGDEHRARTRALRKRIRDLRVVRHKIEFLLGDLYHVLGRNEEEREAYAAADTLRRALLKCKRSGVLIVSQADVMLATEHTAQRAMTDFSQTRYDLKAEMTLEPCGKVEKLGIEIDTLVCHQFNVS